MDKNFAVKTLNEFKDEILEFNENSSFIVITVDFDDIRTGKYLSSDIVLKDKVISEVDYVLRLIDDSEYYEDDYSIVIIYNNEIIFELNTSEIEDLRED